MLKGLSVRHYKKAKKVYEKKFVKGIKIFLKQNKEKWESMVANNIRIFLCMNRGLLSIVKNTIKYTKIL